MSNIFDALEQARRERHKDDPQSLNPVICGSNNSKTGGSVSTNTTDAEIVDMFVRFQEHLNGAGLIMHLISAHPGEGVTSVAQRFASVSSMLLDKKVLLVKLLDDATGADQPFCSHLKWQEVFEGKNPHDFQNQERGSVKEVSLLFDACSKELKQNPGALTKTKNVYDIILFDMPSVSTQPYSADLTRYADVVVIVLESEKTKAFALQSLKERISKNSEALIGVVLNKRCFHIPSKLYSKLH